MAKAKLPGNKSSDTLQDFINEVSSVANHPRLSILVINGFLELMVNILIKAKLKHGKKIFDDNRGYPYATKIIILHELGFIWKDELFQNMNALKDLRNRAAHEPFFELTDSDFRKFHRMSIQEDEWKQIIQRLDITRIAGSVFVELWNPYAEIYLKAFEEMRSKE